MPPPRRAPLHRFSPSPMVAAGRRARPAWRVRPAIAEAGLTGLRTEGTSGAGQAAAAARGWLAGGVHVLGRIGVHLNPRRGLITVLVGVGRFLGSAGGHLRGAAIGDHRAFLERGLAAKRFAGTRALVGKNVGFAEIIREPPTLLLGGRVDQPHQQEKRHHRRDEIRVGDFPRAAVMATFDHLFLADQNRFGVIARLLAFACHSSVPLVPTRGESARTSLTAS